MVINMKVLKKININKDEIKVKLSKYSRTILDFLQKHIYIIYMALPFLAMDIITRIFGKDISFYSFFKLPPNLFTITWIFLFLGLTLTFKKRIGRIIYFFTSVIFLFIFLTNNVYYSLTKTYFDYNLVESASE